VTQFFLVEGYVNPLNLNSAVLSGAAIRTADGSSIPASFVANLEALSLPLSPGTLIMIAPVTALRISTFSTSNSFRDIFSLACASTSAYDILAPSLRVTVTVDARGMRGSVAVLVACPGIFLATVFMLLGPGAPMLLAGITVVLFSLLVSPVVVVSFALFAFLDLTTVHSPSFFVLFRGITVLPDRGRCGYTCSYLLFWKAGSLFYQLFHYIPCYLRA
jgi:hypothetical protein